MNFQNLTKGKIQQTPQTELSKAGKPELMDVQHQIVLNSSKFQDKHLSTENLCLASGSKALRGEKNKLALDEEAVSTQIAGVFIGETSKHHKKYLETFASDKDYMLGVNISMLLAKFQQYQEKILKDTELERELNLFVEPLTIHHNDVTGENRLLQLSYDITRQFLTSQSSKDPRILLLTGQAGSGKSVFCQHLQREILSTWHHNPESDDDENWFSIYVELSCLKNPKSEAITEALARELSLTEEEISFLRTSEPTNLKLPRLLFIFDGYDEIEDIHAFRSLDSKEELVKHNFFELHKIHQEPWKNTKFIITCREENLQKVQRKDLLLGPVSAGPGSFWHRSVEPFSDEQIRCYLRKYCVFEQFSIPPTLLNCLPSDLSPKSISWEQVRLFEQLIDRYSLREIARVPSMLRIICRILPKITSEDFERMGAEDSTETKILSNRFLLDFFVSETIKTNLKRTMETTDSSANQKESKDALGEIKKNQIVDSYIVVINRRAQDFALESSGYSVNEEVKAQGEVIDDSSFTLKLHPLAKWDGNRSRVIFQYPWICEFYIAKSIEEEIREKVPSSAIQDGKLEIPRNLLINQRLLTYGASNSIVLLLLLDAVKNNRLTTEQLIKLIKISREKGGVEQESDFAVAAANAITMLNAAGYDFSGQDLSNISIPGANLSYGMFEGTDFRNANLRGVNFTETWLKNANLVEVQLANIKFCETLGLRLRNEQIFKVAYSLDGKYLAVDVGDQTVIFENASLQKNDFKEIRRIPGSLLYCGDCPFRMNGKQILTSIGKRSRPQKEDSEEEDEEAYYYDEEKEDDSWRVVDGTNVGDEEIEVERERPEAEEENEEENPERDNLSFCFWEITSGNCIEKIDVPIGNKTLLNYNSRRREVMALSGSKVKKHSTTTGSWSEFPITKGDDATNCELSVKDCDILLMRVYKKRMRLCSAITGKSILKFQQRATFFKFSPDGKQIGLRASDDFDDYISMVDTVRGYCIKSLPSEQIHDSSFRLIGQRFLATIGDGLVLQDVSNAQTCLKIPLKKASKDLIYNISLDHSSNQIAYFFKNTDVVELAKLPTTTVLSAPTVTIRGTNNKGLNLQGVIVSSCNKLSDKNIVILQKRGDYGVFPETVLNKLFPSNSEESKAITEVIAINEMLTPIHARIIGSNTYWSNLRKLDLSRNSLEEEGGEAIGGNQSWPQLEELTLKYTQIGDETASQVTNNHIWKNLKKLELASNKIGDIGAIQIGKSKIWVNLEILNLSKNEIGDIGAGMISENTTWEKLATLDLSSNKINEKQTLISLCMNGTWKALKYLYLGCNPAALEASDALKVIQDITSKSLEEIDLSGARFDRALLQCLKYNESESVIELTLVKKEYNAIHAAVIGGNTTWTNLQTLNLDRNSIGVEGATALSHNTIWVNLQTLNLTENKIGTEGATALSHNTTWINLQTLDLGSNSIGAEGGTTISHNTTWINLQTLNLTQNCIMEKGAIALSQNTTWVSLQTLDLKGNWIGDEGATALSQNITWINLQTLNLRFNWIDAKGAIALSQNTTWINLQTLNLACNSIGAEGATALSHNATWINLRTLNLGSSKIGAEGAAALSQNTTWTNLQVLNLESNSIGAEGAAALSQNTTWNNLQTLDLDRNSIGVEGATALSQNTTWTNLQSLNLRNNSIGDKGAIALSQNTTWISLQTLNLGDNLIYNEGTASLKKNQAWPKNIQISYYF